MNFVSMYEDGTSVTFSTDCPSGMDQDPRNLTFYSTGIDIPSFYERFKVERPKTKLLQHNADQLVRLFESKEIDQIAWRKKKGFSDDEVDILRKRRRENIMSTVARAGRQ